MPHDSAVPPSYGTSTDKFRKTKKNVFLGGRGPNNEDLTCTRLAQQECRRATKPLRQKEPLQE